MNVVDRGQWVVDSKSNKRTRGVLLFLVFIACIISDQVTKWLVFNYNEHIPLGPFLISEFRNYHFLFSLPLPPAIMYVVYAVLYAYIAQYLKNNFQKLSISELIAWVFIVSGGLSNLLDRITLSYVRDFFHIPLGGVINLADVYIVAGILYIISTYTKQQTSHE